MVDCRSVSGAQIEENAGRMPRATISAAGNPLGHNKKAGAALTNQCTEQMIITGVRRRQPSRQIIKAPITGNYFYRKHFLNVGSLIYQPVSGM